MSFLLRPRKIRRQFTRPGIDYRCAVQAPRLGLAISVIALAGAIAGCTHRTRVVTVPANVPRVPPALSPSSGAPPLVQSVPGRHVEEGVASWYGVPFNGRRTSNGEVYDMRQFTAAHRTLPFGSIVRVTNLSNGKQTEVRINDRGPFVPNRIIDLSLSAARALDMIGAGTARVKLEVVEAPSYQASSAGFFAVQVGAFAKQENAEKLKEDLDSRYSPVAITPFDSPNGMLYRVCIGRLSTENAARELADRLHDDESYTTFVVRLGDEP